MSARRHDGEGERMNSPRAQARPHTPRDLHAYGRRYGLDYRVPGLSPRAEVPVVTGTVREFSPRPGMQLVASDVEVIHRYDSRSRMHAWRPPSSLLQGLEQALITPLPAPVQRLLFESLGLDN